MTRRSHAYNTYIPTLTQIPTYHRPFFLAASTPHQWYHCHQM